MRTIEVRKIDLPLNTRIGESVYWDDRSWTVIGERKPRLFKPRWVLRLNGIENSQEALSAPVTSQRVEADSGSDFLASAAVGYVTDSPLLGTLAGGDPLGAMLGAGLRSDDTPSQSSEPEPSPSYSSPDPEPSPMLENPDPPSSDSSSSYDSSSDSSSSDCGSSDSGSSDCGSSSCDT